MLVQPYLSFEGRCEEALEFYGKVLDIKIGALMRYKEAPIESRPTEDGNMPLGSENKIMHASFTVGESVVMASDGRCSGKPDFRGVFLTISSVDDAQAKRLFAALGEGGQVSMPLDKTFFASSFGMLADRFGVPWMIIARA